MQIGHSMAYYCVFVSQFSMEPPKSPAAFCQLTKKTAYGVELYLASYLI